MSEAEKIAEYSDLTQCEFRDRVNSAEFAMAVDESLPAAAASPQPCDTLTFWTMDQLPGLVQKHIAHEVKRERERCAKIADEWPEGFGGQSASEIIAAKIRSGE